MDIHEILKMFCSNDEARTNIQTPFSSNGFTYATSGFFLVRIKGDFGYETNDISDKIDKICPINKVAEELYTEIPDTKETIIIKDCPDCSGVGKYDVCPECKGEGTVYWTSDRGYDYEDTCGMCFGSKKTDDSKVNCETCLGAGKIKHDKGIYVGSKYLNARLLSIIKSLPGSKIAPEAVEELKPVPFKFDMGEGIIMPMRKWGEP
jgi:hypothetical protein